MSEDPQIHVHAANTHRKTSQSYAAKASESAALAQSHPYGSPAYRKHESDYEHNDRMRHHHSEQATFSDRRSKGLDPDTGNPFVWD
jgi:hypothetical protein